MATLYITEFVAQPRDGNGQVVNSAEWPPIAEQTVAIGAGSAQSAALNAKTRFVRLHADAICSIAVGANPTAAATNARMAANATEYVGISKALAEAGCKIAVITNT